MHKYLRRIIAILLTMCIVFNTPMSVMAEGSFEAHTDKNLKSVVDSLTNNDVKEEHVVPYLLEIGAKKGVTKKKIMGKLDGKTVFNIYLKENETLLFGAGVRYNTTNENNDIKLYGINNELIGSYVVGNMSGDITEKTSNSMKWDTTKYNPYIYKASKEGIYTLDLGADNMNEKDMYTLYWDITVVEDYQETNDRVIDDNKRVITGKIVDGRVYTQLLCMTVAGNSALPEGSIYYVLTDEGYVYSVDLSGIKPNGFYMFSDENGILKEDGTSLYKSYIAEDNEGNKYDENSKQMYYVGDKSNFYRIFFNNPDTDLVDYLIPEKKTTNINIKDFVLNDINNTSYHGKGGNFIFKSNVSGKYELILDFTSYTNSDGENGGIVRINGEISENQTNKDILVPWDGKDANGKEVTISDNNKYKATINVRVGEMHIPLMDIENFGSGIDISLLNNDGNLVTKAYYNNEDAIDKSVDNYEKYIDEVFNANHSVYGVSTNGILSGAGEYIDPNNPGINPRDKSIIDLWTFASQEDEIEFTIDSYTATGIITNGKLNGESNDVSTEQNYTATIIPNDNYQLPECIKVQIGNGEYLDPESPYVDYDKTTGLVTVKKEIIKDDIKIIAVCDLKDIGVTVNNTRTNVTNATTGLKYGRVYSATILPDDNCEITTFNVKIGDKTYTVNPADGTVKDGDTTVTDIISYTPGTGEFKILEGKTTDDIVIDVVSTPYSATGTITNGTYTGNATVTSNQDYVATITPNANYVLPDKVNVTIGGTTYELNKGEIEAGITYDVVTDSVTGLVTGKITVSDDSIKGDITIEGVCDLKGIGVTINNDAETLVSNTTSGLKYGQPYTATILPVDNCEITLFEVKIGNQEYTINPVSGKVTKKGTNTEVTGVITYNVSTGKLDILEGKTTADMVITVQSDPYTAEGTVTNGSYSGATTVTPNTDYTGTLTANEHYILKNTVSVTVGDGTYTVTAGQEKNGIIYTMSSDRKTGIVTVKDASITGDIKISGQAELQPINVAIITDAESTVTDFTIDLRYGKEYTAIVKPVDNCEITKFEVKIGSKTYYIDASTGKITDSSDNELSTGMSYNTATGKLTVDGSMTVADMVITVESEPYTVTGTITNGDFTGDATVTPNQDYVATITPDANHVIPEEVDVTIGETTYTIAQGQTKNGIKYEAVTDSVTGLVTGKVTVSDDSIAGDITIEGVCDLKGIGVTINNDAETLVTNTTSGLKYGKPYTATILPVDNCEITLLEVKIGSNEYTINPVSGKVTKKGTTTEVTGVMTYDVSTGKLDILSGKTTDDIVITVQSDPYTAEGTVTNGLYSGATVVTPNADYTGTLTANEHYILKNTVSVTVGDDTYTITAGQEKNGISYTMSSDRKTGTVIVKDASITDDIKISGQTELQPINVSIIKDAESTVTDFTTDLRYGKEYTAVVKPVDNCEIIKFEVKIGDKTYYVDASTGKITDSSDNELLTGMSYNPSTGKLTVDGSMTLEDMVITVESEPYSTEGIVTNGTFTGDSAVTPNQDYTCTVIPDTNYVLPDEVKVIIGTDEYTVEAGTPNNGITYDKDTGKVVVPDDLIAADIEVKAECELKPINVSLIADNYTTIGNASTNDLRYGQDYSVTVNAKDNCELTSLQIEINKDDTYTIDVNTGVIKDSAGNVISTDKIKYDITTGKLEIKGSMVTDDVTVKATSRPYSVTSDITKGTFVGANTVTPNASYTGKVVADANCVLPDKIKVTIGTQEYTVENGTSNNGITYDKLTGNVTIADTSIIDDIKVEAVCELKKIEVAINKDNETLVSNATEDLRYGEPYTATVLPEDNSEITKFEVKIGDDEYVVDPLTGKVTGKGTDTVVDDVITYNPSTGKLDILEGKTTSSIEITVETDPYAAKGTVDNGSYSGANVVTPEADYTGTLTANEHYMLEDEVSVTVGSDTFTIKAGEEKNGISYTVSSDNKTGIVKVKDDYITGDINIEGKCELVPIKVDVIKDSETLVTDATEDLRYGEEYVAVIKPIDNCEITKFEIKIGDDIYTVDADNGIVTDSSDNVLTSGIIYDERINELIIDGDMTVEDITITVEAEPYKVIDVINNGNFTGDDEVSPNEDYTCTITPDTNYILPDEVKVSIGGYVYPVKDNVANEGITYDKETGKIVVPDGIISDDIKIEATCELKPIDVKLDTDSYTVVTNPTDDLRYSQDYNVKIKPDDNCEINSFTIKIGDDIYTVDPATGIIKDSDNNTVDSDKMSYDTNTGKLEIKGCVTTDDIVITVKSNPYKVTSDVEYGTFEGDTATTPNQEYTGLITPDENYILPEEVTVTIGDTEYVVELGETKDGITYTETTDSETGEPVGKVVVSDSAIVDDIDIEVICEPRPLDVQVIVDSETVATDKTANPIYKEEYQVTVKPVDNCEITSFEIKIGDVLYKVDPTTGKVTNTTNNTAVTDGIEYNTGTGKLIIEENMTTDDIIINVKSEPYKVTGNISNGEYTGAAEVNPDEDYIAKIIPDENYVLPDEVKVTIGEDEYIVKDSVPNNGITYDKLTGKVTVEDGVIDDDITIDADCTIKDISVVIIRDAETSVTDNTLSLKCNEEYNATIKANSNCKITAFTVKIGDEVYTINPEDGKITDSANAQVLTGMSYDIVSGKFNIKGDMTTDDIVIIVESDAHKVTGVVDNGEYIGAPGVNTGEDYEGMLKADENYVLPDEIKVTIGTDEYTVKDNVPNNDITYDKTTGKVTISDEVIDADVKIEAVCELKDINVIIIKDSETVVTDNVTELKYGEEFSATIYPAKNCEIVSFDIKIGDDVYNVNPESGVVVNASNNTTVTDIIYDTATDKLVIKDTMVTDDIVIEVESDPYDVINDINNGTYDGATEVNPEEDYTGKITADENYVLPEEIKVIIGTEEHIVKDNEPEDGITYDKTTGEVTIEEDSIEGDIIIEVICDLKPIDVTIVKDAETLVTNNDLELRYGEEYNATIKPEVNYEIIIFEIEIGDDKYTVDPETGKVTDSNNNEVPSGITYNVATGELIIDKSLTVEDIVITLDSNLIPEPFDVVGIVTNGEYIGAEGVKPGDSYSATIKADENYVLPDEIKVTINTEEYIVKSKEENNGINYDKTTGKVTIDEDIIDGDVKIEAVCDLKDINVIIIRDAETMVTDNTLDLKYSGIYNATIKAIDNCEMESLQVKIGDSVYTVNLENGKITDSGNNELTSGISFDKSTGKFIIDGTMTVDDIVITVESEPYKAKGIVTNGTYTGANVVNPNEDYTGKISADNNYKLPDSVKVTVGETEYTVKAGQENNGLASGITYNKTTGIVTVSDERIEGDIVIEAICELKDINVIIIRDAETIVTDSTSDLKYGRTYTVNIKAADNCEMTLFEVKIGDSVYTVNPVTGTIKDSSDNVITTGMNYNITTKKFTIEDTMTTADIVITVESEPYKVAGIVTNGTYTGAEVVNPNSDYTGKISAGPNYKLPDTIKVTIGSDEYILTSGVENNGIIYDKGTGNVTISDDEITDDIKIEAECALKDIDVTFVKDAKTVVDYDTLNIKCGDEYKATVKPADNCIITLFEIKIGHDVYVVNPDNGKAIDSGNNEVTDIQYNPVTGELIISGNITLEDIVITVNGKSFEAIGIVEHGSFEGDKGVNLNEDYIAKINADENYELPVKVKVTIGTDEYIVKHNDNNEYIYYDRTTGKVIIAGGIIDDNIRIEAECVKIKVSVVTDNKTDVLEKIEKPKYGEEYKSKIKPKDNCKLTSFEIVIGTEDDKDIYKVDTETGKVTDSEENEVISDISYDMLSGVLYISDKLTVEDIEIRVTARPYTVTADITNGNYTGETEVSPDEDYVGTITANSNHALPTDIQVTIGNDDYTVKSGVENNGIIYDKATGKVTISDDSITGDIKIVAKCLKIEVIVEVDENTIESDKIANPMYGEEYSVTIRPKENYEIILLEIEIEGIVYGVDPKTGVVVNGSTDEVVEDITYDPETGKLIIKDNITVKDIYILAKSQTIVVPTPVPTIQPSNSPTAEPTLQPSGSPTAEPTVKPTIKPSNKPTQEPIIKPTVKPTKTPIIEQIIKPGNKPSTGDTSDVKTHVFTMFASIVEIIWLAVLVKRRKRETK